MIDLTKVVDIVLLLIDGNYGFEMETMEFLNALNSSGMPGNVFGILTHLDLFKKQEALRAQKKRLKHRFWSELYQGAKLFYLSGIINGRYPDREVLNLSRFLSVMKKPRPLIFRQAHPYCLVDRFLDVTPPVQVESDPKCDRTIAFYGYLRGGTNFSSQGARVHVPGLGDLNVSSIEGLPDPCPTPHLQQAIEKATGKKNTRRLGDKQKLLYAPMSDVGGVLVDRDAVYIDVKTSNLNRDEDEEDRGLGEQLMVNLQGDRRLLGEADSGLRLFTGGTEVQNPEDLEDTGRKSRRRARGIDDGEEVGDDDDSGATEVSEEEGSDSDEMEDTRPNGAPRFASKEAINGDATDVGDADVAFADSDSELGSVSTNSDNGDEQDLGDDGDAQDFSDDDGALEWKSDLKENARQLHGKTEPYRTAELAKLLYNDAVSPAEVVRRWKGGKIPDSATDQEDGEEEEFFKRTNAEKAAEEDDPIISDDYYQELERKWTDPEAFEALKLKFASTSLQPAKEGPEDDDDEGDGEFEDLETGETFGGAEDKDPATPNIEEERERNAERKAEFKSRFEEEDRDGFLNDASQSRQEGKEEQEFGEDDWYDAQKAKLDKQQALNRAEFDQLDQLSRAKVEGYRAGTYARIILADVPFEFSASFNPRHPLIVGGLTATEDRFGFVQVRIKRHRWHKKILKTNDPLIFSMGWRRFQSMPIYSISDSRTRNRMLKYTPEHMHCFGSFYGPLVAPATPFCCVQSFSSVNPGFRIAATGVVLNVDESVDIVKKLKLTGHPYKIFKNTAFIKDMFNSALEIAKFEGASIRTVSGVRGQIKRALSKPDGHYRATFEDKILMSDIVFLRAWYPIKPHRFYNPVTNLVGETDGWASMRLTGQVRRAEGIDTPKDQNSAYRKVEREARHFNPLRIPRKLAADLPFKSQPVLTLPQRQETYMQKRVVVVDGEEKKARNLMQQVLTLRRAKADKRRESKEKHREAHRKRVAESDEKRKEREKRERDDFWRREGKKRNAWEQQGGPRKRAKSS
jgi:ribosome biogenesis protein BMS1